MGKIVQINKTVEIRPYSKKELCSIMELTPHILKRWLKAMQPELGEPMCGQYNVKQVRMIIDRYGLPYEIITEAA